MEYRYDPEKGLFLQNLERMSPAQKRELSQIVQFWMGKDVIIHDKILGHYMPRDNFQRALSHIITISPRISDDLFEQLDFISVRSYEHRMRPQVPNFDWIGGVIPLRSEAVAILELSDPLMKRFKPSHLQPLRYGKYGESEI